MPKLRLVDKTEIDTAIAIIHTAKEYLREQGIEQWQLGYPDKACLEQDIAQHKGYFLTDNDTILAYLCIDYDGDPAYEQLKGAWHSDGPYVVVHRLAFTAAARGKGMSQLIFSLVIEMSKEKGIHAFRVDTDTTNQRMLHILKKNGFAYCGTIWFIDSEKIAFDKIFE